MAKSKRNKRSGHTTVVKVSGGQSSGFSRVLKWLIIGVLLLSILFGVSSCRNQNKGTGEGKGLIKAPAWLEEILPERPSWLPSWMPSLFYREEIIKTEDGTGNNGEDNEGNGTGGTGGNGGETPDAPSQPNTPNTPAGPSIPDVQTGYVITFDANGGTLSTEETTRTTNANGMLSTMPGAHLTDYWFLGWFSAIDGGEEITIQTVFTSDTTVYARWCDHVDIDYNEECDICKSVYHYIHKDSDLDGECDECGYAPCVHIDEDKDGVCDSCEHAFCEHIDENDDGKCDDCKNDISEKDHECIYENEDIFCDICGSPLSFAGGSVGDGNEGADPDEPIEPETPDAPQEPDTPEGGEGTEGDGNGTGGTSGNEGDAPDAPQEPDAPDCTHRDADDDGGCDVCGDTYDDGCDFHVDADDNVECDKCGDEYEDGLNPEICEHRDLDDDKDCDICWIEFDDGCNHRDADDDGACDKCGDEFSDGCNNHIDVNVVNGQCDICYRTIDEDCEHQDVTEDGYCDTCNVVYDDGCNHNDADKNRYCDKCGLYCLHRDEDDNNYCDGCKMVYWDGYNPANCSHYDNDDDGYCDRCKIEYDDGCTCVDEDSNTYCDKCESCMHRDANDDLKCDRCETSFDDDCNCRDEDDDNACDKCDEFYYDGCEHVGEGEVCAICGQSLMTGDANGDGYDDSINGGYWNNADCYYVYSSVTGITDKGYYMEDLTLVSYVSNGPFMHNTKPYKHKDVDDSLIYFTFGICDADGTVEDMAGVIYTAERMLDAIGTETEGIWEGANYKSGVSELTWGDWIMTRGLGSFTDENGVTWYKVAGGTYMTVGAETGTVYVYGGGSYVSTLHLSLSAEYTSYEITADERIGNYVYYITTVYGLSMEVI